MNIKLFIFLALFCSGIFTIPMFANAQRPDAYEGGGSTQNVNAGGDTQIVPFHIDNPLKYDTLDKFITAIMRLVLQIMTPVIAVLIIWTGFLFVNARGNETKITQAKQAFFWVIVGAAIMLGAFVLKSAIEGTVGQLGDGSVIFTILQPYV